MLKHDNQFLSPCGEHTTTDTTPAGAIAHPAADDTRYLDQLAELWSGHRRSDLSVRHQTGMLLNNKFGPPTTCQKRGDGVLQAAAERSGQSVSELSRMRNFAHHFESFDEFVRKHGNRTWTEVKALLPTLKGGDATGQKGKARPGKNAKRTVTRCRDRLVTLTERLEQVEANDLTRGLAQEWRDSLAAFAEVVSARFGIVVTVVGVREESESEEVCTAAVAG
jgi:hypothetical protein